MVEYHSLAAKLGLPPLPPVLINDRHLQTERAAPRTKSYNAHSGNQAVLGAAHLPDLPLNALTKVKDSTSPRFLDSATRRPKALFVSDSLGTPTHARGIYHYSTALSQILRDIGFELTLVVEKSPGYGLERHTLKSNLSSISLDTFQSAEINRYFNSNIFSFRWKYENMRVQKLVAKHPFMVRIAQRIFYIFRPRYNTVVNNLSKAIDFLPYQARHLENFDRFLYIDRFYSASMECALNDLDPPALNAARYDLVIIDTPHYVRLRNIPPSRVFTVIHDLIPLHDAMFGR